MNHFNFSVKKDHQGKTTSGAWKLTYLLTVQFEGIYWFALRGNARMACIQACK